MSDKHSPFFSLLLVPVYRGGLYVCVVCVCVCVEFVISASPLAPLGEGVLGCGG